MLERVNLYLRPYRLTRNSGSVGFNHPNRWARFNEANCGIVKKCGMMMFCDCVGFFDKI